jgi:hypothetical protein
MTISHDEDWIWIAELDAEDRIFFTAEYRELMEELGWEAKAFAGHLIGLWYDPFEHLLDHGSGEAEYTRDQPGTFDRNALDEPQDVVEYWAKTWSETGKHDDPAQNAGTGLGLGVGWYRDVLRAKLVSLRLPRRLLEEYKAQVLAKIRELEELFEKRGYKRVELPLEPISRQAVEDPSERQ